ncbi:MAG: UDP-N-acetylmuramate--L-alanine ligase [Lachnospiraceae bacterium]
MYQINFSQPCCVHFIGIGGISMSGLAEILMQEGFTVSGSDAKESDLTKKLEADGAKLYFGQRASNISDNIDVVVYTAAVHEDNPELMAARSKGLHILSRAELLGQLMKNYHYAINVSGTHGKTTTTSMLAHILMEAKVDPTITVGGILPSIGGNIRVGNNEYFLAEACEYTNSFLSFCPTHSIILNIKADHLDFFKDLDDIRHSFRLFAEKTPAGGALIVNGEIENLEYITQGLPCPVLTFGKDSNSDYYPANITYNEVGFPGFDVINHGDNLGHIQLAVPGEHNIYNALSAIALCLQLEIPFTAIQLGLQTFTGTNRRFQIKGKLSNITIVDDYAHHPDEISATLKAANAYPHKHLWCVFQPHTYSRTKALFEEFVESLSAAEHVILANIYAARETDTLGVSSKQLAEELQKKGVLAYAFDSFEEIENFLLQNCVDGDLILTMGAGDIYKVGEALL